MQQETSSLLSSSPLSPPFPLLIPLATRTSASRGALRISSTLVLGPFLRLSEAQKLDAGSTTRVRERSLHALKVCLQILVTRALRVRLRDLRVELRERFLGGFGDVPRERLVHELNLERCLRRNSVFFYKK